MNNELGSVLFLYAETPLHAGSGASLGSVDLPIQRERMSGHPVVQGSGIKGALREAFHPPRVEEEVWLELFGPRLFDSKKNRDSGGNEVDAAVREDHAGAISVQDARLLVLPVRSLWGGFAWTTCPLILKRLARDIACSGLSQPAWAKMIEGLEKDLDEKPVVVGEPSMVSGQGVVTLESYDYLAKTNKSLVDALAAWLCDYAIPQEKEGYEHLRKQVGKRLVIMSDQEFAYWAEIGMEVVTRIAIDRDTGTVKKGALWSEESLPAESILWAPMFFTNGKKPKPEKKSPDGKPTREEENAKASHLRKLVHEKLNGSRLRLGGDRTVGRGIVVASVALDAKGGA